MGNDGEDTARRCCPGGGFPGSFKGEGGDSLVAALGTPVVIPRGLHGVQSQGGIL